MFEPTIDRPLVAYRAWAVVGDHLHSTGTGGTFWHNEEHAVCVLRAHDAPARHCSCGLYACHDLDTARGLSSPTSHVLGAVELWGEVEVYRHGVRAEHARIVALLASNSYAQRAAARHGLPLLTEGEFLEMARDGREEVPARLMPTATRREPFVIGTCGVALLALLVFDGGGATANLRLLITLIEALAALSWLVRS